MQEFRSSRSDFASKASCFKITSSPRTRRTRLGLIFGFAFMWVGLVLMRLVSLQVSGAEAWEGWAKRQHVKEVELASERGPILDRNQRLLAVSVPAGSVYVRPKQVQDKEKASAQIAEILNLDRKQVRQKMEDPKPFVWIKRQVPRAQAEKVTALNLQGVGHMLESRRFYPYNEAASTLIGKVGIDGNGLTGLESLYEKHLHADEMKARVAKDALGKMIDVSLVEEDEFEPPRGNALQLTLDSSLQLIMDEEVEAGRKAANAKAAMAIMIDSDTGEILALSQSPGVNLNDQDVRDLGALKNRLVETVYEPGSTLKPLVAAAALEERVTTPDEVINCESGRLRFGRHTIKDVHPHALITVKDIVIRSSNIGMTKLGVRLGKERLYSYLRLFGFGESSQLGLPGETRGIFRSVQSWANVDVATHSFGQGIAVTPLQMVRAFAAIANGGELPQLKLVMDGKDGQRKRVISQQTAHRIREMLYGVVEDEHGTGHLASVKGVRIGGKTGTAQKARKNGRGYQPGAYVASFIGFADASAIGIKQNLTLMVIVDEPNANSIYGGTLAGPVFRKIMQRSLQFMSTRNEIMPEFNRYKEFRDGIDENMTRISYNF